MALPLMPILAGVGALTGGIQGYRQSGGDLGATTLGALTGGTLTSGIGSLGRRFAGAALGKTALGKMVPQLMKAGDPLGAVLAAAPAAAGIGAAGLVGLPAAAALAGPLGGSTSRLAGQAAQAGAQALGVGSQVTGVGQTQLPGTPGYGADQLTPGQLSQYGPQNLGQTFDSTGYQMTQLALEDEQFRRNLRNTLQALPYQEAYQQRSKEADLLRGAKATQLATALATDAAMRRQGQLGAQAMGEGLMRNVGQAGATQYRYF